jgi:hypothetical protein
MGLISKRWVVLLIALGILVTVGTGNLSAQQYFNFSGKVVNIYRGTLSVKGDKGETMNFAVGRRTIYVPARLPGVGERVKVNYYLQRGYNVAYQVEILPPPSSTPPPKKK